MARRNMDMVLFEFKTLVEFHQNVDSTVSPPKCFRNFFKCFHVNGLTAENLGIVVAV